MGDDIDLFCLGRWRWANQVIMTSRPKWIEEILLDDYMLRETPEQSQEDLAIIRSVEQTILHDRDQSRDDIVYSNYANFIYGYQWSGYKEELDDQL